MKGMELLEDLEFIDEGLIEAAELPLKAGTARRTAFRLGLVAAAMAVLSVGVIGAYTRWHMPDTGQTYQGEPIQVHETQIYTVPKQETETQTQPPAAELSDQWFLEQAQQVLRQVDRLDLDAEQLTLTRQENQLWSREEVLVSFSEDDGQSRDVCFDAASGYLIGVTAWGAAEENGAPMSQEEALAVAQGYYDALPYARGYEFSYVEKFDDHAWMFDFDKPMEISLSGKAHTIKSDYEQVRITIDPCTGEFILSNCFYVPLLDDHEPGAEPLSQAQAQQIAQELDIFAQDLEQYTVTAELGVCLPNPGLTAAWLGRGEAADYQYYPVTRLGWVLKYEGSLNGFADSYQICVDLYTGEVLSIDGTQ